MGWLAIPTSVNLGNYDFPTMGKKSTLWLDSNCIWVHCQFQEPSSRSHYKSGLSAIPTLLPRHQLTLHPQGAGPPNQATTARTTTSLCWGKKEPFLIPSCRLLSPLCENHPFPHITILWREKCVGSNLTQKSTGPCALVAARVEQTGRKSWECIRGQCPPVLRPRWGDSFTGPAPPR